MYFELSVRIRREPDDVFAFLRDKDLFPQEPGSPVLVLVRTTPGPVGVGTRYREVVQMLPFFRGEIHSVVTRFEPPRFLEEDFSGAGMSGHLAYEFVSDGGATILIQRQTVDAHGLLRPLSGIVEHALAGRLRKRLVSIDAILESGWKVDRPGSPPEQGRGACSVSHVKH